MRSLILKWRLLIHKKYAKMISNMIYEHAIHQRIITLHNDDGTVANTIEIEEFSSIDYIEDLNELVGKSPTSLLFCNSLDSVHLLLCLLINKLRSICWNFGITIIVWLRIIFGKDNF